MAKINAKWVKCSQDKKEHEMRDNCWNCAPWWFWIPICPEHNIKLVASGFCKKCKKYYDLAHRPD